MTNKYKCEKYKPNAAICTHCHEVLWAKYYALLEFVQKIHADKWAWENADHISWDASALLKELGEI